MGISTFGMGVAVWGVKLFDIKSQKTKMLSCAPLMKFINGFTVPKCISYCIIKSNGIFHIYSLRRKLRVLIIKGNLPGLTWPNYHLQNSCNVPTVPCPSPIFCR